MEKEIKTTIFRAEYTLYVGEIIKDISVYIFSESEEKLRVILLEMVKNSNKYIKIFKDIDLYFDVRKVKLYISQLNSDAIRLDFKIAEKYRGRYPYLSRIKEGLRKIEEIIFKELNDPKNFILSESDEPEPDVNRAYFSQGRKYLKLKSFSAKNFKILDGTADFSDINIVIGENNSGKTSFLQALYLYLKALKHIYVNIDNLGNEIYIDKEFFDIITQNGSTEKIRDQLFFSEKAKIEFEGIFSVSPVEEFSIKLNIGYKQKKFYIQIENKSLSNIKAIKNLLGNTEFNFLFLPNTNVRFESELYLPYSDKLKDLLFYKLIKYKSHEILRNLVIFLKRENNFLDLLQTNFKFLNIKDIKEEVDNLSRLNLYTISNLEESFLDRFLTELQIGKSSQDRLVKILVEKLDLNLSEEDILNDFESMEIFGSKPEERKNKILEYLLNHVSQKAEIDNLGQGYKEILFILSCIEFLKYKSNPSFIIMDEPAMFLHPSLKENFANSLTSLVEDNKLQIFYSTHDPKLVPDETYNVSVIKLNRKYKVEFENVYTLSSIYKFFSEIGYMELISRNIQRIKHNKNILFVEGISDLDYLRFLQKLEINLSDKEIDLQSSAIIPLNSVQNVTQIPDIIKGIVTFIASEISNSDQEIRNFKNSLKIHILLDGDLIIHPCLRTIVYTELRRKLSSISELNILMLNSYSIENLFISKEILEILCDYYGANFSEFWEFFNEKVLLSERYLSDDDLLERNIDDAVYKRTEQRLENLLRIYEDSFLTTCSTVKNIKNLLEESKKIISNNLLRYTKGKTTIELFYNFIIQKSGKIFETSKNMKTFIYDLYKISNLKPNYFRSNIKINLSRMLNE